MARVVMAVAVAALAAIVGTASGAHAPAAAPRMAPVPPTSAMLPPNLPCVAQLAPCAEYYQNASVKPAEACCSPLKTAYASELDCLCAVLTNPALGAAIGVDLNKGMGFFRRCGVKVPADICSKHAAAPAPASSSASSPGSASKSSGAAADGAGWVGYSGFLCFLLALWSLLA